MAGRVAGLAVAISTIVFADDCDGEYAAFVSKFGKTATPERKAVFCANLQYIEETNSANDLNYTLGVNAYTDWTEDEFMVLLGGEATNYSDPEVQANLWEPPADYTPPNYGVDWRSRMPPIKDQGQCGSCWAFAALDVVDFAAGGSHSEQQALDCTRGSTCQGGNPGAALQMLARYGSISERNYPYRGSRGYCQTRGKPIAARVSRVQNVRGERNIAAAASRQVVSVCISGGSNLQHYHGGVFDQNCGQGGGHCIGVVGYTNDYWILRNSWSASWGLGGYFYFRRGRNLCSIGTRGAVIAQARGRMEGDSQNVSGDWPTLDVVV